jgi:hypothetical protein
MTTTGKGIFLPSALWDHFGERIVVYHASSKLFKSFDRSFWNSGIGNHKTTSFMYKYFQFTKTFNGAVKAGKELRTPSYFVHTVSIPEKLLVSMGLMDWEDLYDGHYPYSVGLTYCRHCVVIRSDLIS